MFMKRITVLLAEDHTVVRQGLRKMLELEEDIEVVGEAQDGRQAVAMVKKLRPAIVLMDIAMPGADGYEVARRLSAMPELGNETIYIGVTGFGQPEDFRRSEAAGFAQHLVKPLDPVELDGVLRRVLNAAARMKPPVWRAPS